MTRRPTAHAAILLGLALSGAASGAELGPGARGYVITALEGATLERIPVTFLGTYHDFAGPGFDIHLVRLEGPHAERVGVAAGMSGSPVYFEDRVIGALSYRLGQLPTEPVAGVTPLEDMLASARAGAAATEIAGAAPIASPLVTSGLAPEARAWLGTHLEPFGLVLSGGGGDAAAVEGPPLEPGSPIGVQLMRGDMRIAATGTVTWIDGDRVWAFGHPFLGAGRVELPMVRAEVIHTLADLAGSVKLANVGGEIGAFVEDRRAAIVGLQHGKVAMVPLGLEITGGDYRDSKYSFEIARHSQLAPLMAAVAVMNTLQAAPGYSQQSTLRLGGHVDLGKHGKLPLEMAFASSDGDPTVAAGSQLLALLGSLWTSPFRDLEVAAIELHVDAAAEVVTYQLEDVLFDRTEFDSGETVVVRCRLRRFQGGVETRELRIQLPQPLPDRDELTLAVGNPLTLDRALGSRLQRRLEGARDVESFLGVLGDIPSAHRLVAVVFDRRGSVIARSPSFERLPPTAERLLATQAPRSTRPGTAFSALARAELELDGPVLGLETEKIRLGRMRARGEAAR